MKATDHKRTIGVFQGGVRRQNGVVRFNDRAGQLRSRIHAKLQFRLLAIVSGETFQQQSTKPGTGPTPEGAENEETLKSGTIIRQPPNPLHNRVDELLSDGVMTTSICET